MLDWLACTLVKALSWVFCRLPPAVAVRGGALAGTLAGWVQPKRMRIGVRNVCAAFDGRVTPSEARGIVGAAFRHMGAGLVELLRLPVIDEAYVKRYVTLEHYHRFEEAATSGKPAILLTAHYGNWELSSIVAAFKGHPIVALAREQRHFPRLYQLLVSYRESKGCRIVHKGGELKRLIAALDANQLVGIVGDQASRQGIWAPLLGRPALFATGPFTLAHSKGAVILPVFTHRVDGPFHRIVLEPPILPTPDLPEAHVVQQNVERFAQLLERHVQEDPTQWLWMHKRWKCTPARKLLIVSDGKQGHLKQSLAVAELLRRDHPHLTTEVVEVRYRHHLARVMALLWSLGMPGGRRWCLARVLTQASYQRLVCQYADLVVSCGASVAPINLLWSAQQQAKSIVVMNPAPLPLRRFDLVIAPVHDRLPRSARVIPVQGALTALDRRGLEEAAQRLRAHPNFRAMSGTPHEGPLMAVLIGGETPHYAMPTSFIETLMTHVLSVCEQRDGACIVTTSRRTSPEVERWLIAHLGCHPRCRFLLIANHDEVDGTMEGILGLSQAVVVTGESISMVSEACASGRPVVVAMPPARRAHRSRVTKHQRFLKTLLDDEAIACGSSSEVGTLLKPLLDHPAASRGLDASAHVRHALSRLL